MTRKTGLVLILAAALILPLAIIPASHAKRNAASQKFSGQSLSELAAKLPASAQLASQGAKSAQEAAGAGQSYAERMHKGEDTANIYPDNVNEMSSMGRRAYLQAWAREQARQGKGIGVNGGSGCLSDDPDCEDEGEGSVGLADKQAEMGIAVDPSGTHVVIGFNEAQGFSSNPNLLSGFATSHDGGATFTVTGALPSPGNQTIGTTKYPQIFGDPDIKWLPAPSTPNGGVFIYASIMVRTITGPTGTGTVQSMCLHRSLDFGNTWEGPFEITPTANPNGTFNGNNARDSADKEFIDVDPDTGRVLVAWSNFTSATFSPVGKQMMTTYSDNVATANPPTWSTPNIVNLAGTIPGQGIIPRFAGNGSPNVYVTYQSQTTTLAAQEYFARSTDNGVTFSPAVPLNGSTFKFMDYILGNDRSHCFPWMDVDLSSGLFSGNIYIVYANNNLNDGADIVFQKSVDGGLNFTAPVTLNARPGQDRPQWFPVVSVDRTTGRVWVFYYDQGVADSGDTMETSAVYSDDGGVTWSNQISLSDRPFHAGYGNDTGQPNLGDYNNAQAQGGNLYATFAYTPPVVNFTDGQPATTFPSIDAFFKKTSETPARAGLEIRNHPPGGVSMLEKPSTQTGELTIPLTNITTNPLDTPTIYSGVTATLTTSTPDVSVTTGTSGYPNIAPGTTQTNTTTYVVQFAPTFVWGTKVDFQLDVTTAQGSRTLLFSQNTGNKQNVTTLMSETFENLVPAGANAVGGLPAGWTTSHGGGANTVPWQTSLRMPKTNAPSPTFGGLWHQNANDSSNTNQTRFERAFSPLINIPANSRFVSIDFDIAYDTEDEPSFVYEAYDGALLRITDQTTGRTLRSVLTETFADLQQTGNLLHYPKHLPRNSSSAYLEDMSAWAGDSTQHSGNNAGFMHVHMLFPGMAGSTVQLRFEYTQDSNGICTDNRPTDTNCGVLIDNLTVNSITYSAPTAADASLSGKVLTPDGQPLAGVVMQLGGNKSERTVTGSDGGYRFDNLETSQFYTVRPARSNYSFTPAERSFSLAADKTDAVFTANPASIPTGNPLDTDMFFVRQQYVDFLGREPDGGGLAYWTSEVDKCGLDARCLMDRRIGVAAAFFMSQEFEQTGSFIYRLYNAGLGRQLSYAEFSGDRGQVIGGDNLVVTKETFLEQFVERPEFVQRYGSATTAEAYVDALLATVKQSSGVDLSSERAALIDKYNLIRDNREKRPEVLKDVIEAAAFKQAVYNPSFVLMEYFGYLKRDPEKEGYDFWLNVLNNKEPENYRGMVCSFITSAEYQLRFSPIVTHSNRECQ